jgi:predicted cupin superfamily sugar epimerase
MIDELIASLGLMPHPEGGYYRERYRSQIAVTRPDGSQRSALTLIDFLLPAGVISRWHRVLGSEETWHFAGGDPLELQRRRADEEPETLIVDAKNTWKLIPAGWWQSARSLGQWTLVQCCVAPGFDFADFELEEQTPVA